MRKDFFRVWGLGYRSPSRFVDALAEKNAPQWGVAGQGIRALLDSLVLYLPLALMGRAPSTPSWFTFLPTERYYAVAVFFAPLFLFCQWLLLAAVLHVTLRLLGRPGGFDRILNLTGMVALVAGAFLLAWDWVYLALGLGGALLLGISHLVIDIWVVALTVLGLKRLLDVPVPLGIALNVLWLAAGVPLAMLFLRAPV